MKMKVISLKKIIFIILFSCCIMPFLARAQVKISNPVSLTSVEELIDSGRKFLLGLSIPLSTIMMIWAGILFLTSEGDPQKISQAKSIVKYVVIGIIVVILASGLSFIIAEILS